MFHLRPLFCALPSSSCSIFSFFLVNVFALMQSPPPAGLAGGRGRGATLPAWMTTMSIDKDDKSRKKSHKKVRWGRRLHVDCNQVFLLWVSRETLPVSARGIVVRTHVQTAYGFSFVLLLLLCDVNIISCIFCCCFVFFRVLKESKERSSSCA